MNAALLDRGDGMRDRLLRDLAFQAHPGAALRSGGNGCHHMQARVPPL